MTTSTTCRHRHHPDVEPVYGYAPCLDCRAEWVEVTAETRAPRPPAATNGHRAARAVDPYAGVPAVGAELAAVRPGEQRDGEPAGRRLIVRRASDVRPRVARWLWEPEPGFGRIPAGELSVLAGRGNVGKSPFALWGIAHLTRGTLPGVHYGHPRPALIYASEDSIEHTIVPRLIAADADLDRVSFLVGTEDPESGVMPLNWVRDRPLIEQEVRSIAAAALVLDPLVDVHTAGANTDRNQDVRAGLQPLVNLAHRTRCSVLGIAHFNKRGGSDLAALLSGSHGLRDLARAVIVFVQNRESGQYVLGQDKNNLGLAGDDMARLTYAMRSVMVPIENEHGDLEDVSHPAFEITGTTDSTLGEVLVAEVAKAPAELPENLLWVFQRIAAGHPRPLHVSVLRTEVEATAAKWDTVQRKLRETRLFVWEQPDGPGHPWLIRLSETGSRRLDEAS